MNRVHLLLVSNKTLYCIHFDAIVFTELVAELFLLHLPVFTLSSYPVIISVRQFHVVGMLPDILVNCTAKNNCSLTSYFFILFLYSLTVSKIFCLFAPFRNTRILLVFITSLCCLLLAFLDDF